MSKFTYIPLSLALIMSASLAQATLTDNGGGSYQMESCGLAQGTNFDVTVNGRSVGGGQVGKTQCAKHTFHGDVSPGDHLVILVNGRGVAADTVPGSRSAPVQTVPTTHTVVTQTVSSQGQIQPAPVQVLPSADLDDAKTRGKDAAKEMAARVVTVYASAERSLYNFYMGMQDSINYNYNPNSIQNSNDYIVGQQRGQNDGQNDGTVQGSAQGSSDGNSQGSGDAVARFRAAVDQTSLPDVDLKVREVNSTGWTPNNAQPKSIQERLDEKNGQFLQILNSRVYGDGDYHLQENFYTAQVITLAQLYGWGDTYQFNGFLNTYADTDWGFNNWLNKTLGGKLDEKYYKKISDSSRTANASEAGQAFRDGFAKEYAKTVRNDYIIYMETRDSYFYDQGRTMGDQIVHEHIEDLGHYAGYQTAFKQASGPAYNSSYKNAYKNGFQNTVSRYENNIMISEVNAVLVPETPGHKFLPGATVDLVINKIVNMGSIHGQVPVQIAGSSVKPGAIQNLNVLERRTMPVPPETHIVMPKIGAINGNVVPNTDLTAVIDVNGVQYSFSFKVDFSDMVIALANASADANLTKYYSQRVNWFLADELKKADGSDFYSKKASFLESFVAAYTDQSTTPAQRKALLAFKPGLDQMYTAQKPSGFSLNFNAKKRWTAIQALLAQLH